MKAYISSAKKSILYPPPPTGRSMIEMLAVLAMIAILTVGAIAGLTWALDKYQANEVLKEATAQATELKLRSRAYLSSDGEIQYAYASKYISSRKYEDDTRKVILLFAENITKGVCDKLVLRDNQTHPLFTSILVDDAFVECQKGNNTVVFKIGGTPSPKVCDDGYVLVNNNKCEKLTCTPAGFWDDKPAFKCSIGEQKHPCGELCNSTGTECRYGNCCNGMADCTTDCPGTTGWSSNTEYGQCFDGTLSCFYAEQDDVFDDVYRCKNSDQMCCIAEYNAGTQKFDCIRGSCSDNCPSGWKYETIKDQYYMGCHNKTYNISCIADSAKGWLCYKGSSECYSGTQMCDPETPAGCGTCTNYCPDGFTQDDTGHYCQKGNLICDLRGDKTTCYIGSVASGNMCGYSCSQFGADQICENGLCKNVCPNGTEWKYIDSTFGFGCVDLANNITCYLLSNASYCRYNGEACGSACTNYDWQKCASFTDEMCAPAFCANMGIATTNENCLTSTGEQKKKCPYGKAVTDTCICDTKPENATSSAHYKVITASDFPDNLLKVGELCCAPNQRNINGVCNALAL